MSKVRKIHKEGAVFLHLSRACCWAARDLKYCATVEIWFATPVTNPSGSPEGSWFSRQLYMSLTSLFST